MRTLATTRRRMLELSAAVPALWFLRDLDRDARADAATPATARRFLLLYHAMGTSGAYWYGAGADPLPLGDTLTPLADVKSDLVLVRNTQNVPGCEYWSGQHGCAKLGNNDQHSVATCTLLAPTRTVDPNAYHTYAGMETFDWFVGRALAKKNGYAPTAPPLLLLTPAHAAKSGVDTLSAFRTAGGQLEYPTCAANPVAVYQQYLKGARATGAAPATPADMAAAGRRRQARALVTDFAAGEVGQYQRQLPADLRPRLDAHLAHLRELEAALSADGAAGPTASGARCDPGAAPDATLAAPTQANYRARCEVTADLAVAALACGVTPAVHLQWWTFNGGIAPPNLAGTRTYPELHTGLQHLQGYTAKDVSDCHQHLAYQTARIIKKLKSIPDGSGTMMDTTMLLWTSDMGMNPVDHNKKNLPFVVAGRAAGKLKGGRMVDVAGMSHVRLLTALTHLLGVPTDSFGDARYNDGGPALPVFTG